MMLTHTTEAVDRLFAEGVVQNIAIRIGYNQQVAGELYRSADQDRQITAETLFDMASVSKILCPTMLALMAMDRGLLHPEDLVSRYLPVPAHNKELKIRHLLTHTTGVGHVAMNYPHVNYENVAAFLLDQTGEPIGSDTIYSCPAFIILGKILEQIYQKPLDVLFEEKVASLLGMKRTGYRPVVRGLNDIVNSNLSVEEQGIVNDYNCKHLGGVAGNAGVFSCIKDLTLFARMLLQSGAYGKEGACRLFGKDVFDLAVKDYTADKSESRGLGFVYVDKRYPQTGNLFPVGSFGHCGHTGTSLFVNRESGLYVVILSDATISTVKKYGQEDYDQVMAMRSILHNALLEDITNM